MRDHQEDDILEYDEDNVVVIDLTEERNSSSKFRRTSGGGEGGPVAPGGGGMQPRVGELALHEVRYENYLDTETNRTIEIKRQVYYDDSDLISPPGDGDTFRDQTQTAQHQQTSNHDSQVPCPNPILFVWESQSTL